MSALFNTITENELVSQVLGRCGITRRKVFQYVSLFCVLIVIYSICFSMFLKVASASPTHAQLDALLPRLGKSALSGHCLSLYWLTPTRLGARAMPLQSVPVHGLLCMKAFRSTAKSARLGWRCRFSGLFCVLCWLMGL